MTDFSEFTLLLLSSKTSLICHPHFATFSYDLLYVRVPCIISVYGRTVRCCY